MSKGRPDPFSSLEGEHRVVTMTKVIQDRVQGVLPILLKSAGISKQGDRAVLRHESIVQEDLFEDVDDVLRSTLDSLISPKVMSENEGRDFSYWVIFSEAGKASQPFHHDKQRSVIRAFISFQADKV